MIRSDPLCLELLTPNTITEYLSYSLLPTKKADFKAKMDAHNSLIWTQQDH